MKSNIGEGEHYPLAQALEVINQRLDRNYNVDHLLFLSTYEPLRIICYVPSDSAIPLFIETGEMAETEGIECFSNGYFYLDETDDHHCEYVLSLVHKTEHTGYTHITRHYGDGDNQHLRIADLSKSIKDGVFVGDDCGFVKELVKQGKLNRTHIGYYGHFKPHKELFYILEQDISFYVKYVEDRDADQFIRLTDLAEIRGRELTAKPDLVTTLSKCVYASVRVAYHISVEKPVYKLRLPRDYCEPNGMPVCDSGNYDESYHGMVLLAGSTVLNLLESEGQKIQCGKFSDRFYEISIASSRAIMRENFTQEDMGVQGNSFDGYSCDDGFIEIGIGDLWVYRDDLHKVEVQRNSSTSDDQSESVSVVPTWSPEKYGFPAWFVEMCPHHTSWPKIGKNPGEDTLKQRYKWQASVIRYAKSNTIKDHKKVCRTIAAREPNYALLNRNAKNKLAEKIRQQTFSVGRCIKAIKVSTENKLL